MPLLHISLTHLRLTYLQHNLNGEHRGEYNICVGQDLRERCKSLTCFFFFSLVKVKIRWRVAACYLVPVGLGVDGVLSRQRDGGQQNKEQDQVGERRGIDNLVAQLSEPG